MALFAFYEGWRISEIRRLKRADVDLKAGCAYVLQKNGELSRKVLRQVSLDIIRRQPENGDYVFHKGNGKPFVTGMHDCIRAAAERAGVKLPPRKRWHLLRYTWATMMLQAGADVRTLQAEGDWKDATMPLHYAQAMRDHERRAFKETLPVLDVGPYVTKKSQNENDEI